MKPKIGLTRAFWLSFLMWMTAMVFFAIGLVVVFMVLLNAAIIAFSMTLSVIVACVLVLASILTLFFGGSLVWIGCTNVVEHWALDDYPAAEFERLRVALYRAVLADEKYALWDEPPAEADKDTTERGAKDVANEGTGQS